jgi:sulfite reductase alpha subunit-like flavoprotein
MWMSAHVFVHKHTRIRSNYLLNVNPKARRGTHEKLCVFVRPSAFRLPRCARVCVYIYIYIYICVYVRVSACVCRMHLSPVCVCVDAPHRQLDTPVVMCGPGTGVAPFMAFLQEAEVLRQKEKILGKWVLFYGCRYKKVLMCALCV